VIAERCRAAGHAVHWQEADDLQQASLAADEADLVLLGCWTDNAGRTPSEMHGAGIAERGERPAAGGVRYRRDTVGAGVLTAALCTG
jgi:hypothetical protein